MRAKPTPATTAAEGSALLQVLTPSAVATVLGVSTTALARLVREGGYPYTALARGGRPGDRGRGRWGLTIAQLGVIVAGPARRPSPADAPGRQPAIAATALLPGGVDLLRSRSRARRRGGSDAQGPRG
jgi:hypothetical protein